MGRAAASLMEKVCTDSVERNPCQFHVKQSPETRCLSSPARGQTFRSKHPNARPVPNARLNLRRRPQNLFCACFSCTNTDRAGFSPPSGSSVPKRKQPAGIGGFLGFPSARPLPSFSLKIINQILPPHPIPPRISFTQSVSFHYIKGKTNERKTDRTALRHLPGDRL